MISVIVVHHNGRDVLDRCLAAVVDSRDVELEVIVVDNRSTDGSSEMLRERYPVVRLLPLGRNTGFAYGTNRGIEACRGEAILLLNNDVVVSADTIAKLWRVTQEVKNSSAVVAVLRNRDGTVQPSSYSWPSIVKALAHLAGADGVLRAIGVGGTKGARVCKALKPRAIKVAKFACVLLPRVSIQQVGLLDESFFMYGEDADWCYRAHKAGLTAFIVPTAEAVHLTRPRVFDPEHPMFIHQHCALFRYHKKHSSSSGYRVLRHLGLAILRVRLGLAPLFNPKCVGPLSALLPEIQNGGL